MYKLLVSDEAILDIADAMFWYNVSQGGLGDKFQKDLKTQLDLLRTNPESFQLRYKNVRVLFLKKYPFGIHYFIEENIIKVIAVFHTKRNPKRWTERLK